MHVMQFCCRWTKVENNFVEELRTKQISQWKKSEVLALRLRSLRIDMIERIKTRIGMSFFLVRFIPFIPCQYFLAQG